MRFPAVALALVSGAVLQAQTTLSLNGNWQFQLPRDERTMAALEGFFRLGYDASQFRSLPVPANWALHGFEEAMYGRLTTAGEGFYRREFAVPAGFGSQRVLLHFGGVWSSAEVWWNGVWVGRHDSGFTSFAFDVSPLVRAGETNVLAVRVRQITRDYTFDANDDWSLGGIFRDVWLEAMPASCYIERVETNIVFDSEYRDADLQIRILVVERRGGPDRYTLHVALKDADGQSAGEARVDVTGHPRTGRDTLLKIHVPKARHWTAETPHLYQVSTRLEVNGKPTHEREHEVGFREVSTAGGVLRVNGHSVKLRGVCRHDEHPDVGIATRREHWLEDLRLMKQGNINAVRTVHYPPNQGFLELCDRMGIYVIDEVPLGYGGDLAEDPSYAGTVMLRAFETVVRDRNHPSVIVWSIGNENPITALHLAAARYVKGADPTRPILFPWHPSPELPAGAGGLPGDWMPPEADILAPHYPTAAQALAMTARANRPVIATEYAHAWAENRFGDLAADFRALTASPAGAGGMIWMWQDQGLRINGRMLLVPDGEDGIVRADRTPQRDYWEAKAVYAPVSVPVSKLEWKEGMRSLRIAVANDYDFLDLSAVRIHWRLMADERELSNGDAHLATPPHTIGWIEIPAATVATAEARETCYVHLIFHREDGTEITTRAVEIVRPAAEAPLRRAIRLTVRGPHTVKVTADAVTYEFDPRTARLISIRAAGKQLTGEMHLTLWRPLDLYERLAYKRYGTDASRFPDLNQYTTTVQKWRVETDDRGVHLEAQAEHQSGERNRFEAWYRYTVRATDGALEVEYGVTPSLEAPWIPEVGMEVEVAAAISAVRWLGLGPMESAPNLRTATIFGVWNLPAADASTRQLRSGVRWVEVNKDLRFEDCGYFRLDGDSRIRILSAVEGRGAKYRRAENPEDRLDVNSAEPFSGRFWVRVAGNQASPR